MGKNRVKGVGGKLSAGDGGKSRAGSSSSSQRFIYAGLALAVALVAVGLQLYGRAPVLPVPEAPRDQPVKKAPPRRQGKHPVTEPAARMPVAKSSGTQKWQDQPIDPTCVDDDESCTSWARSGECDRNIGFMRTSCRASCHICNGGKPPPKSVEACEDSNSNCATWAAIGECQSNPGFMLKNCPVTCKMCQSETCKDELPNCAERCRGGAASNFSDSLNCYFEPELVEKCAWTCGACKEHRFDQPRCKRRPGTTAAAVAGSVNQIFGRISEMKGVTVLSSDPWVVTIDDFLSHPECDQILKAGSASGVDWARSMAGDGVQAARTSSTAWCKGSCLADPVVQRVEKRVSDLLGGIPMENAEPMQVLRYESGQFYKVHHDQNSPRSSAWGPRMFTVFMYTGDGYEGGLTHFPRLNLTIPAKKGAACVWTSVLDSDPYQRDDRTDHESLPVESGTKFGVNYWIHMYPFRTMQNGCDNQAYVQNWF